MRRRPASAVLWPFWLLAAAWFCANVPPTATLHAMEWLKGAGHFSHYADLRQDVASLLAGPPRATPAEFASAATSPPLPPALPGTVTLKKIDFALSPGLLRLVTTLSVSIPPPGEVRLPEAPVADVPYPPPRVRGQA